MHAIFNNRFSKISYWIARTGRNGLKGTTESNGEAQVN